MNTAQTRPRKAFPDEVGALKHRIAVQQESLVQKEALLLQQETLIAQKEQRIRILEEFIRLEKLRRFAARSEKLPAAAIPDLFNEAELTVAAEQILAEEAPATKAPRQPRQTPRRQPLPVALPRIRIDHDLPADQQHCACGGALTVIGEECSEQLDIIPAQVRVLVNVRKKYACRHCEETVKTAPLPPQPIPKSNASPGLLAQVVVSKYADALPLYRQEGILKRHGVALPRQTLAHWMIKAGQLVQPLLNLLEETLLAYPVLQCDETTVQVLTEPDKPPDSHSYMWVRVGGPPTQPVRLFHYADSRRAQVPSDLLADYQGYLQTDDYGGYHAVGKRADIIPLGCWAHARRKFVEAQKAAPKGTKTGKATLALTLIGKLYALEQRLRDLAPAAKYAIRQQEAVPQLHKIRAWLDNTLHTTLPKGLLGKALGYLDKNWEKLTVYTEDGRLAIDNNAAENAIRPFVLGRKNWLFSATVPGAKASANLYSLIETAKANGVEPYAYLRHVFKELPQAQTVEATEKLLPWNLSVDNLAIK